MTSCGEQTPYSHNFPYFCPLIPSLIETQVHIYGIRHHGPSSARALLAALEAQSPDCLLIEGPEDGTEAIAFVADADMVPPVALLLYNPKQLEQASFYPFAEFSPEWQAMRWAMQQQHEVRFVDLPAGKMFVLDNAENELLKGIGRKFRQDPFTEMAALAGYSDSERFWEAVVERQGGETATFEAVGEMMRALREANEGHESQETLLREANMRQGIRQAIKDGFQNIAVVCGAWHLPALEQWSSIKQTVDAKALRGMKKVKTATAWIPWSYDRLSSQSGYGAGVRAPLWYEFLFSKNKNATSNWMANAAKALRDEDLSASAAHAVEAVRLADTLAVMRNTQKPGIEELRQAVVSVLCGGSEAQMDLIDRKVVIGEKIGKIPDSVPKVPLKADFEAQLKSCRLKLNSFAEVLNLDLRKDAQLRKSVLLHRLNLLKITFGQEQEGVDGSRRQGSFHEDWVVEWQPEMEIKLIEMGVWGNTIEEAAKLYTQTQIPYKTKLSELVELLQVALKSALPDLLPALLKQLRDTAAQASDALILADTLLPLVEVQRYGSARNLHLPSIKELLDETIPRVCILLPDACRKLDMDEAKSVFQKVLNVNRAIGLQNDREATELWQHCLKTIAQNNGSAPALSGLASRLLYDTGRFSAATIRLFLSGIRSEVPMDMALWLEGFLYGSGMLLLLQDDFRQLLDAWVQNLRHELFQEVLPLLRRAFSKYSPVEREKLLYLLKEKEGGQKVENVQLNADLQKEIEPMLRLLLG